MTSRIHCVTAFAFVSVACSASPPDSTGGPPAVRLLDEDELRDPTSCGSCHPNHLAEWDTSMHAHASRDPVFLAMNRRGQEEVGDALGDFCVKCHAPVALELGLTTNGLNLESLPDYAQGVTCYFCHSVAEVTADHNNGLGLARDGAMRGPIEHPIKGAAHRMTYSALHDRARPESSDLCGSCHDVVLDNGVKLERSALEWRGSIFSPDHASTPSGVATCTGCHMRDEGAPSVVETPSSHPGHDHRSMDVDVALSGADADTLAEQRKRVGAFLDTSLGVEICVQPTGALQSAIYVTLENASSGHFFPTGASQDRRVWIEVTAYDSSGAELYSSGKLAPDDGGDADPDLWSLHDSTLAGDGSPAHMFWDVAKVEQHGIPAPVTSDPSSADALIHHVTRRFPRSRTANVPGAVARVSVLAHLRPIGFDVLDDLVASKHLDGSLRAGMPVFDIVPNRHLADHPTLGALATETFEWSDAIRKSGLFVTRVLNDDAFPKNCVSMMQKQ